MEFLPFPKMARLNREIIVTEKIDGTNAQVVIVEDRDFDSDTAFINKIVSVNGFAVFAGSRTRWITPENDNFGFAAWVKKHAEELIVGLGHGQHFGEWWGRGIQRGYGKADRTFSLFNTSRWYDDLNHKKLAPACCEVVPILYKGPFDQGYINNQIERLKELGSFAQRGFKDPEGIVVYHTAANAGFKITIKNDDVPKGVLQ